MSDKQKFIKWLESDISDKECMMNRIIDIYANLEKYLNYNHIYIREPFEIFLIRLAYFLYENSKIADE